MWYNKTKLIYITLNSSNYLNKINYDHFETLMIMSWWNQIKIIQSLNMTFANLGCFEQNL
jgi:hypothetical protein